MNENMRVSDADRERVAERLRENFAEGRLTSEELDERIAAALSAKTSGELRAVMADLPEPAPVGPAAGQVPPAWAERPVIAYRGGPRILPLVAILLFAGLVLHGAGFVLAAFLQVILLFWLVTCLAGIFGAARFRRRARRYWQSGPGSQWHHDHDHDHWHHQ